MISVFCPKDGTLHYAEESHVGKSMRCRKCGATLIVGAEGQSQAQPPPIEINTEPLKKKAETEVTDGAPGKNIANGASPQKRISGALYILIGTGLGALAVVLFLSFWQRNQPDVTNPINSNGRNPGAQESSMKPSADASAPGQAKRSNATSRKAIPAPEPTPIGPLPPCAQGHEPKHLKTGDRIEPDGRKSGESNIQVMNRSNLDAVVRLVDNSTSKTSRFVYVQAGHSFALGDIEAGTYWVRFEFGSDWMPECRDFMRDSAYREFASPLVFVDDRVRLYQVTLSPVVGRRAAAKKVDRQRFLEGD